MKLTSKGDGTAVAIKNTVKPDFELIVASKEKLFNKYVKVGDCHEYVGSLNKYGYGLFRVSAKYYSVTAHRAVMMILENRPLPPNVLVCHKCDNRKCINPDHLFLGSAQDNMTDMALKGRSLRKNKNSRFIGVSQRKDTSKWQAYVCYKNKYINVGNFDSEIDAALARNDFIDEHKYPAFKNNLPPKDYLQKPNQ